MAVKGTTHPQINIPKKLWTYVSILMDIIVYIYASDYIIEPPSPPPPHFTCKELE